MEELVQNQKQRPSEKTNPPLPSCLLFLQSLHRHPPFSLSISSPSPITFTPAAVNHPLRCTWTRVKKNSPSHGRLENCGAHNSRAPSLPLPSQMHAPESAAHHVRIQRLLREISLHPGPANGGPTAKRRGSGGPPMSLLESQMGPGHLGYRPSGVSCDSERETWRHINKSDGRSANRKIGRSEPTSGRLSDSPTSVRSTPNALGPLDPTPTVRIGLPTPRENVAGVNRSNGGRDEIEPSNTWSLG